MEDKTLFSHKLCDTAFRCLEFETSGPLLKLNNILVRNYFFLESYVHLEEAFSHNNLYITIKKILAIARYQVSCYAYNYFE